MRPVWQDCLDKSQGPSKYDQDKNQGEFIKPQTYISLKAITSLLALSTAQSGHQFQIIVKNNNRALTPFYPTRQITKTYLTQLPLSWDDSEHMRLHLLNGINGYLDIAEIYPWKVREN